MSASGAEGSGGVSATLSAWFEQFRRSERTALLRRQLVETANEIEKYSARLNMSPFATSSVQYAVQGMVGGAVVFCTRVAYVGTRSLLGKSAPPVPLRYYALLPLLSGVISAIIFPTSELIAMEARKQSRQSSSSSSSVPWWKSKKDVIAGTAIGLGGVQIYRWSPLNRIPGYAPFLMASVFIPHALVLTGTAIVYMENLERMMEERRKEEEEQERRARKERIKAIMEEEKK